jgi:hypothetical protein
MLCWTKLYAHEERPNGEGAAPRGGGAIISAAVPGEFSASLRVRTHCRVLGRTAPWQWHQPQPLANTLVRNGRCPKVLPATSDLARLGRWCGRMRCPQRATDHLALRHSSRSYSVVPYIFIWKNTFDARCCAWIKSPAYGGIATYGVHSSGYA